MSKFFFTKWLYNGVAPLVQNEQDNNKKPNSSDIKIGGSLARRVALLSSSFFVIPILFYSFYVYHKIYNEQLSFVYEELSRVEHEQLLTLEGWTEYEMEVLHLIYHVVQARQAKQPTISQEEFDKILNKFTLRDNVNAIAYIGLDSCTQYVCNATSSNMISIQEIMQKIPYDKLQKMQQVQYIQYFPNLGHCLVLARTMPIDLEKSQQPTAIVLSVTGIDNLLSRISIIQSSYEANLSILNSQGKVLSSTNGSYVSKYINYEQGAYIQLQNSTLGENGLYFKKDGKLRFAVLSKYTPADVFFLLDVPEYSVLKHWYLYLRKMIILFLSVLVIGGCAVVIVTHRISKPLRRLIKCMIEVGSGDLSERYKPDAMGFELNQVGQAFNQMVESLINNMKNLEEEKIKREVYIKELQIGQNAQQSLLPKNFPDVPFLDIDAGCIPASEVGGDFYEVFKDQSDRMLICVADTSGKGISACIFSLSFRSMLRSFFYSGNSLEEIIHKCNELFIRDTADSGMFVTAWIGIIDLKTNELQFSNCGHVPTILYQSSSTTEMLSSEGMALGVSTFKPVVKSIKFGEGDTLLLYSDGIIEAHSPTNELFGESRLIKLLTETSWYTCKELVRNIQREVRDFSDAKPQHDDLTVLVIRHWKE